MYRIALLLSILLPAAAVALTPEQEQFLRNRSALSTGAVTDLVSRTSPQALRATVEEILALDNLSVGGRTTYQGVGEGSGGGEGEAAIHRYVRQRIADTPGVVLLGELRGRAVVPVRVDNRLDPALDTGGARLTVARRDLPVTPLWPNGAMPSLTPGGGAEGLTGPLVWVDDAEWSDLNGLKLDGAIAVMSFRGARNWVRLFSLGAQAVVVVEDRYVGRQYAERLFSTTPVPFPRFYAAGEAAEAVRELAMSGSGGRALTPGPSEQNVDPSPPAPLPRKGGGSGNTPVIATLRGGHVWEERPFRSAFAYLPPTQPTTYTVRRDDLLERLAVSFGTSTGELRRFNDTLPGDGSPSFSARQIKVPGRPDEPYKVVADDLLRRIAVDFGVTLKELRDSNPALVRGPPTVGQTLTVPNLEQPVVVAVPMDSVSVAPDEPHGQKVAVNIAAALTLMDHLARSPDPVRRRGVVFAFLDAENVGGLSSRTLAEVTLRSAGKFGVTRDGETPVAWWLNISWIAMVLVGLAMAAVGCLLTFFLSARGIEDKVVRRRQRVRRVLTAVGPYLLLGLLLGFLPQYYRQAARAMRVDVAPLESYRRAVDFVERGERVRLDDTVGRWFVEDWLLSRLETSRGDVTDRIVDLKRRRRDINEGTPERAEADAAYEALEPWGRELGELRSRTLSNTDLPGYGERAAAFFAELRKRDTDYAPFGLTESAVRERLLAEYREEASLEDIRENNRALAAKLNRVLRADADHPTMGWWFDLSDGSSSIGLKVTGYTFRDGTSLPGKTGDETNRRLSATLKFAMRELGWEQPWAFLTRDDESVHPVLVDMPAVYDEFWTPLGVAVVPIGTINDTDERLDTPWDVPARADFDRLSAQARHLLLLVRLGLEDATVAAAPSQVKVPDFGQLTGKALRFNTRSGIDAQEPVAEALVFSPGDQKKNTSFAHNPSVWFGHRRAQVAITRLSGSYEFPLENAGWSNGGSRSVATAYRLDPTSAVFTMAVDEGQVGTQKQMSTFDLTKEGFVTTRNMTLTSVYPRVLFPGPDPVDYEAIGAGGKQQLEVIDAVLDGEPAHFALDNPAERFGEQDLAATVLYMPPGRRARVRALSLGAYKLLLTGEVTDAFPQGEGYLVGPVVNEAGKVTDRNLSLTLTDVRAGHDMLVAGRELYDTLDAKGVRDRDVKAALAAAERELQLADEAAADGRWQASIGHGREGWGVMVRTFPTLLGLGREAVFSAVLLMALLLPAAYFLERLTLGGKGIVRRLTGTVAIFVAGAAFLNYFHPAFGISVSPFIVVIAFAMILMSGIVLALSYGKFDVLVRRARAAGGEVEGERISLGSSLATGLSLGVSNLRKRPSRTALTAFTVTALTFSIVTFVSVKGSAALDVRPVPLSTDAVDETTGGEAIMPLAPKYQGALFRGYYWRDLSDDFVDALRSEFGTDYEIAVRGHYLQKEGGNNADIEGVNQVLIRRVPSPAEEGAAAEGGDEAKKYPEQVVLTGIMAFEPAERDFSHLNEAVTNRQWFQPGERYSTILPLNAAERLGIAAEDLYNGTPEQIAAGEAVLRPRERLPHVQFNNRRWAVTGILDTRLADRYRDLTGQSLAMVDFLKSGFSPSAGEGDLVNEPQGYHLSWSRLLIVPMDAAADVKARPKSVAVKFQSAADAEAFYDRVTMRLNRAMFGTTPETMGLGGAGVTPVSNRGGDTATEVAAPVVAAPGASGLALITTKTSSSVAGIAKVVVPVILCVLIVLNTMLGTVDERKGEVGMLGAVGLSPSQIAFLLLSESAVYSVLGIVLGVCGGLFFGWVVAMLNPSGDPEGFMGGLSLNFASLASMGLAMLAGVVVLLATLIPARKAARLAAPSGMEKWELPEPESDGSIRFALPFTLTRGNAVGMLSFFRQFLLNHSDPAAEGFNCRDVHVAIQRPPSDPADALTVDCTMWLAPYDLDVAQQMTLRILPADAFEADEQAPLAPNRLVSQGGGTFGVEIVIRRTSGTQDAWMRTNHRLMDLVRRQFLLWRNLTPAGRSRYIDRGADLVREAA